jgi:hypothetical protein
MSYFKLCVLSISLVLSIISYGEEPTSSYTPVILHSQESKKKTPPINTPTYLEYHDGEACLQTSYEYGFAILEGIDTNGDVVSTAIVTPEQKCANFYIEGGYTIICTIDNETILSGVM